VLRKQFERQVKGIDESKRVGIEQQETLLEMSVEPHLYVTDRVLARASEMFGRSTLRKAALIAGNIWTYFLKRFDNKWVLIWSSQSFGPTY
jgi:hypothetical protein